MKRNKKGISLAIVIVVVMALMIFSAMLFSAASHSLSMTGESTDGRQTYLTAKSAIEFSKTTAFDLAKAGSLKPFAVTIGADGSFAQDAGVSPDSVAGLNLSGNDCAKCWNTDGNSWKILANVKYKNSSKYRQLAYTFTLTPNASANLPASDFLACGVNYGTNKVFDNSGWWPELGSVTSSVYPVVETFPLNTDGGGQTKSVKTPELFLLEDSSKVQGNFLDAGHYSLLVNYGYCNIASDSIYIDSDVFTSSSSYEKWDKSAIIISNTAVMRLNPSTQGALNGIIYFAGSNGGSCLIKRGNSGNPADARVSVPSGFYSFDAGFDLASIIPDPQSSSSFLDNYGKSGSKRMTKVADTTVSQVFRQDIAFEQSGKVGNGSSLLTGAAWSVSKGADFAPNGVFGSGSSCLKQNNHWYALSSDQQTNMLDVDTVFTYATATGWQTSCQYPWYNDAYGNQLAVNSNSKDYNVYCAKQFFLRFVSSVNNFILPGSYNNAFHSDLVSLSMAVSDTDAGTNADSRPKIVQATNASTSQFLLTSLSTDASGNHKDVTLAVQNDIKVVYSGGSYVIPSGIYSVPSGFNFFDSKSNWSSFWTSCRKGGYPVPGSGGSGGAGGFTITPGAYSGS